DENNNMVKEINDYNIRYYQYDENNNIIEKIEYDYVGLKNITYYKYDENNNMIEEIDDYIPLIYKYIYKYDENNNMIGCMISRLEEFEEYGETVKEEKPVAIYEIEFIYK
nr:hypothetical protein [Spirochaetota bacterium]